MNKKGGITGFLITIILGLFFLAFSSLLANTMWNTANDEIQSLPNETVSQEIKDEINALTTLEDISDKAFVITFVLFLIAYILVASLARTENKILFLFSIILLVVLTIFAMILSNAWQYLIENPTLSGAAADLTFTTFFMRFFPLIMFLVGIVGAIIYYGRTHSEGSSLIGGGGSVDFE